MRLPGKDRSANQLRCAASNRDTLKESLMEDYFIFDEKE